MLNSFPLFTILKIIIASLSSFKGNQGFFFFLYHYERMDLNLFDVYQPIALIILVDA